MIISILLSMFLCLIRTYFCFALCLEGVSVWTSRLRVVVVPSSTDIILSRPSATHNGQMSQKYHGAVMHNAQKSYANLGIAVWSLYESSYIPSPNICNEIALLLLLLPARLVHSPPAVRLARSLWISHPADVDKQCLSLLPSSFFSWQYPSPLLLEHPLLSFLDSGGGGKTLQKKIRWGWPPEGQGVYYTGLNRW